MSRGETAQSTGGLQRPPWLSRDAGRSGHLRSSRSVTRPSERRPARAGGSGPGPAREAPRDTAPRGALRPAAPEEDGGPAPVERHDPRRCLGTSAGARHPGAGSAAEAPDESRTPCGSRARSPLPGGSAAVPPPPRLTAPRAGVRRAPRDTRGAAPRLAHLLRRLRLGAAPAARPDGRQVPQAQDVRLHLRREKAPSRRPLWAARPAGGGWTGAGPSAAGGRPVPARPHLGSGWGRAGAVPPARPPLPPGAAVPALAPSAIACAFRPIRRGLPGSAGRAAGQSERGRAARGSAGQGSRPRGAASLLFSSRGRRRPSSPLPPPSPRHLRPNGRGRRGTAGRRARGREWSGWGWMCAAVTGRAQSWGKSEGKSVPVTALCSALSGRAFPERFSVRGAIRLSF